ncbi:MAG: hypothetical protein K5894_09780 [Lachnospiraceae bacterium]|nr:hypothetical protein [Lachnospiraceae bacterium]
MESRGLKKFISLIAAFLTAALIICVPAMAASSTTATIPVTQNYSEKNKIPSNLNRTFKYILKANDSSYPLPSGGSNGSYSFSLTSTQSVKLSISYTETGVYKYTLKQVIPDSKISRMTYDSSEYSITVSVKNNGSGLVNEVYISNSGSSYKSDSATFNNEYVGKKSSDSDDDDDDDDDDGTTSVASSGASSAVDAGVLGDTNAPDSGVLGDKEGPDTGDRSNPVLWIGLMAASIFIIIAAVSMLKVDKNKAA